MGTIYGQGDKVFLDKDADNGFHECPKFCDVFRPRMMLFEAVENFTVRDVTLQDAAFWTLHMAGCRHVRIQNIMILNDDRGANNDGIAPDCCQDVVISNCIVRTGDDAIVVKSTGPMSRRYGASENRGHHGLHLTFPRFCAENRNRDPRCDPQCDAERLRH